MCQPFSSCNLPPAHRLAEWPGSCCGNTGVERIPKQVSAQKVYPGERKKEISRRSCRASNPTPFGHESVALPLSHPRPPSFSPSVLPRDDAMPIMTPPVALDQRPHESVNVSLIGRFARSHFTARPFHRHSRKAVRDATLDLGYGDSEHHFRAVSTTDAEIYVPFVVDTKLSEILSVVLGEGQHVASHSSLDAGTPAVFPNFASSVRSTSFPLRPL